MDNRTRPLWLSRINRLKKRVVGEAGLEPAKLTQGIYSPPPLPLGTFPQRAVSKPPDHSVPTLSDGNETKAFGFGRPLR